MTAALTLSETMLAFRKKGALQGKLMNLFRMLNKYSSDARIYLEQIIDKANENKTKKSIFLATEIFLTLKNNEWNSSFKNCWKC